MEEVCARFPFLAEEIMKELDYQSLAKCREVGRKICGFLDNGRVLWKQMILKNIAGTVKVFSEHEIFLPRI